MGEKLQETHEEFPLWGVRKLSVNIVINHLEQLITSTNTWSDVKAIQIGRNLFLVTFAKKENSICPRN